jgi:hypothetical protein
MFGVRVPARQAEPVHEALDLPSMPHPARPGH